MTKLNRNKKFIKLIYLAAIVPVFALGALVSNNNKNVKPVFAASEGLKPTDVATYGGLHGGYYDVSKALSDTGEAFPNVSPYSATQYGAIYLANPSQLDGTINYSIVDEHTIKIEAPYILPCVDCTTTGHQLSARFTRYVWWGEDGEYFKEDVWKNEIKIKSNRAGQLNAKGLTIKGTKLGSVSESTLTYQKQDIDHNNEKFALQNLVITLTDSIYDYKELTLDFGKINYTDLVYTDQVASDGFIYTSAPCDEGSEYELKFTLNPSSQRTLHGEKLPYIADSETWYEIPTKPSGNYKSVDSLSFANQQISNDLPNIQDNLTYIGAAQGFGEYTYEDQYGNRVTTNALKPHDEGTYIPSSNYDVYVAAEYRRTGYNIEINDVYAFSDLSKCNEFKASQRDKLIKTCDVFKDHYPVAAFNLEHSPLFTDYEFYKNGVMVDVPGEDEYAMYHTPNSTTMQQVAIEGDYFPLQEQESFYSLPNIKHGDTTVSFHNFFIANQRSANESYWNKQCSPSGTDSFKSIINTLFSDSSSPIDTISYVTDETETNNKITFKSADKLFVSIIKDEEDPTPLTASTTYNLHSGTDYATINIGGITSPDYNFSDPGTYKIKLTNRGSDFSIEKTLNVYDKKDFLLQTTKANNKELDMKIALPTGSALDSLKIYKKSNSSEHTAGQTYIEELNAVPDLTGYSQLTQDDNSKVITPSVSSYSFKHANSSLINPFADTYYVEAVLYNQPKYYKLHWNYVPAQADTIKVDVANWVSNVGYQTSYAVTYSSTTGEDVDPSKEDYTISIEDPTIISIDKDNQIIKGLKAGTTTATFTLTEERGSVTKTFIIQDTEANRKEIRPSSSNVEVQVLHDVDFSAYANPLSLFDQSKLTYTIADTTVASYANGKISGLKVGSTTLTISHPSEELKDVVVPIVVKEIPTTQYTLTVTCGEHGSVTGNQQTYAAGTTATLNIKADQGYQINSISFNGENITITNDQEMCLSKVINQNSTLVVTFKERTSPVPTTYNLTVNNGEGGTVTGNKATYNDGETMTVVVTANENYEIDAITFNNETIEVTNKETMTVTKTINSDSSLTITYKAKSTPTPDPTPGDSKTPVIIGVACGVGAVVIGLLTFLIIKAKKSGSMKK